MNIEKSQCKGYKQICITFKDDRYLLFQLWGLKLWRYGSKFKVDIWEYYPYMNYSLDLFGLSILYRGWAK